MIKVSDFIVQALVDYGAKHVFMFTGGMAMHLNDSFGKHSGIETIYNHHEQASAMAAESYARITGNVGIINVTSGPGSINALNGVYGAWTDSVPMLIVSGQAKRETLTQTYNMPGLRQLGDQEVDIAAMVKRITKYGVMIVEPESIRYHIEKALYLASSGRPGPVWIDVPVDVQGVMVDENSMTRYDPSEDKHEIPDKVDHQTISEIINRIKKAKRPVILAGSGIRISGAYELFLKLIGILNVPVTTAWNAHDLLYDDHPYYFGRPGTIGDRPGNFIVQNADLLLVLGSRLNIRQISYNWESFAREAYKIVVDVDKCELEKPTLAIDLPIHSDLRDFITQMIEGFNGKCLQEKSEWVSWCRERRERYPVVLKEYWDLKERVNPYCFMKALSEHLPEGQITVCGDGTACVTSFQSMFIKEGQRLYTNSGCASMGYDLPAAIGACIGSGGQKIVCLAGDGSIMLNVQELQTIVFNRYPVKIFILNNSGYHSVRQTQESFYGLPYVGCSPESGVGFPDFEKLAKAFGFPYARCSKHDDMDKCIRLVLDDPGFYMCEVMLTLDQPFAPKLSAKQLSSGKVVSPPLEDLHPFLDKSELMENLLIKPLMNE